MANPIRYNIHLENLVKSWCGMFLECILAKQRFDSKYSFYRFHSWNLSWDLWSRICSLWYGLAKENDLFFLQDLLAYRKKCDWNTNFSLSSENIVYTKRLWIYDFPIFTVVYSPLHGFIWNQRNDQLPVGLLAQLVEHWNGIAEVMGSNPVQNQNFSGLIFTTAEVAFITAKIAFIFTWSILQYRYNGAF